MRIAIVNDSAPAAEMLRLVLAAGGHKLAWIARSGADAVRLCAGDRPELVLMDPHLPQRDGVDAIRQIMCDTPCAILLVTAAPQDNVGLVFRALGAGALDVAATPLAPGQAHDGAELLAKIRTIGKLTGCAAPVPPPQPASGISHLVAIGASTGGPVAIAKILAGWTPPAQAAIVVVQHIDAAFAEHFARWLGEQLAMPVKAARDGDPLEGGVLQVARSNDHLRLGPGQRLYYDGQPQHLPYRPSVDVFFHSVREYWGRSATAVLLTGMGQDGAAGLLALRQAGHLTIAQDQASSAVYGMPRAAAEIGAAEQILPLENIGAALRSRIPSCK